jgi:hypothetical protein
MLLYGQTIVNHLQPEPLNKKVLESIVNHLHLKSLYKKALESILGIP